MACPVAALVEKAAFFCEAGFCPVSAGVERNDKNLQEPFKLGQHLRASPLAL
jgi:hypothetical protein